MATKYRRLPTLLMIAGLVILLPLWGMARLPSLRGENVVPFLLLFIPLSLGYLLAVLQSETISASPLLIWGFAVLFRLVIFTTAPSLSDDVYRYIWDGHLLNQGVNPYAHPVDSSALDTYSISFRNLVNNDWMASPYLPAAQGMFALMNAFAPQSVQIFQLGALIFDLATAWLLVDLLRRFTLPTAGVLIYLWNPLVILEFSHGAHIDAMMIFFVVLSFWLIVRWLPEERLLSAGLWGSVFSMAIATLTKGLPLLLAPIFLRRWGWARTGLYALLIAIILTPFAASAGWGLTGSVDGTGVFGAIRIYTRYWSFNSSLYHWLEVLVTGYNTPGAVPVEIAGERTIQWIRIVTSLLIGVTALIAGILAWRKDIIQENDIKQRTLYLVRLALLPVGTYLILTHTLHPWYVTFILPILPFYLSRPDEVNRTKRLLWPWVFLSLGVVASYYTYLNPEDLREYAWVRMVEYFPFYLLLIWGIATYLHPWDSSMAEKPVLR